MLEHDPLASQTFVGLLADRFGGVRTLIGGGLAMATGGLLFPLANSAPALFAARALTGFGASFMYLSIIKETDRLFAPRHFTVVVGVVLSVGYAGGMAATLPFERAASGLGWRPCLLAIAGFSFMAVAATGLILRRLGHEKSSTEPLSFRPLLEVVRNRACWPLFASGVIMFPVSFMIQTVLGKKFLQDYGGMSSPASATVILVMTAVSGLGVILGGLLPQRLGARRKPGLVFGALMLLASIGVLFAGILIHAPGWVYLCGYVIMAAASVGVPCGTATMKDLCRPESVAAGISVLNGMTYIACGTIGQAGGMILDRYRSSAAMTAAGIVYPRAGYIALFAVISVLAALNLWFTTRIPETRGQNSYDPLVFDQA